MDRSRAATAGRGVIHRYMAVCRCGTQIKMCEIYEEYDVALNVPTGRWLAKWPGCNEPTYYVIDERGVCGSLA